MRSGPPFLKKGERTNMVKKKDSNRSEIREHVKDGKGAVQFCHIFEQDELLGKARTFAVMKMKPGTSIGDHPHVGEAEAYYVLKGEVEVSDDGEKITLGEGDAMLTGKGHSHAIENKSAADAEVLAIIML